MTTVLLLDWPLGVRRALRARLSLERDLVIVGEADDAVQAVRLAQELRPDVVLVDAETPDLDASELVSLIVREHHRPRIILLSLHAAAVRHLLKDTPAEVVGKDEGLPALVGIIRSAAPLSVERPTRARRRRRVA